MKILFFRSKRSFSDFLRRRRTPTYLNRWKFHCREISRTKRAGKSKKYWIFFFLYRVPSTFGLKFTHFNRMKKYNKISV